MNKAKFHIPLLYRKWDDCKIVKIKLPFKKNSSLKNDYDNLNIKKNQDVSAKFLWTFSHTVTKVLVELDKGKRCLFVSLGSCRPSVVINFAHFNLPLQIYFRQQMEPNLARMVLRKMRFSLVQMKDT